jgi:hypothetical protein
LRSRLNPGYRGRLTTGRKAINISEHAPLEVFAISYGDQIIATAIRDRLLHHSTTIDIRGESYRLKERHKAGLIPLPEQQEAEPPILANRSRSKRGQLP